MTPGSSGWSRSQTHGSDDIKELRTTIQCSPARHQIGTQIHSVPFPFSSLSSSSYRPRRFRPPSVPPPTPFPPPLPFAASLLPPPPMASLNLGWFGENWFPNPHRPSNVPAFAFIGGRNLFFQKPKSSPNSKLTASSSSSLSSDAASENPGKYSRMLDQFFWECQTGPDYRHTPEVERILSEDPVFDAKENALPEEVEENQKWWEEFRQNPVVQFLKRCEDIRDKLNEMDLKENEHPYRREDRSLWKKLPHVTGPDGRPMPRKSIKTRKEASDKFWDWAKQFYFGLWGFRQRPYPPGRPIDVAQAIGYKKLERRYYDCEFSNCSWV